MRMNILHLKYAVEVAKTKSISKAAENLYMGQPNLSRAIKELEESLGIMIFDRNPKGITVTPQGEEFLQYARRIISQVDEVEQMYKSRASGKQKFSACVPRASYISYAFAEFARQIDLLSPAEIYYKETNSMRTIANVSKEDYSLGIIRYQTAFDKYFQMMFEEKKLAHEKITDFSYRLLISSKSPLAEKEEIEMSELGQYIEITHADPYVPSMPLIDVKKAELSEFVDKRIYVFERASQFNLLETVPHTFMWVSPIPDSLCERYGLVQRAVRANTKTYCDVFIYRGDYKLTSLDRLFMEEVRKARDAYVDPPAYR